MREYNLPEAPDYDVAVHIPLKLLRVKTRVTQELWLKYDEELDARIRYCQQHGIPYLGGIVKPSPDKAVEELSTKSNHYHVEYMMYKLLVTAMQKIVYKATKGEILGSEYDGAVYDITGDAWVANLI